jgi:hypothetical protein
MRPSSQIHNVAHSVHQRLLNRARLENADFNLLLQRYAIERFLYRLGLSSEVDRFTLKGATLFWVWARQQFRPTRDVDLLATGSQDHAAIRRAIEEICAVPCPEDGVLFDPKSIRIEDIREEQEYGGVRAFLRGSLGQARLALQVDIGFGDVSTPERSEREYPTLLDHPAPRLWVYPRETLIAEKFEAMVHLGPLNSRVKDLWDVTAMARYFDFDGELLREAIAETFRRRGTTLGGQKPESLQPAFYEDPKRTRYWQEFQRQVEASAYGPMRLVDAGEEIRHFLSPLCDSLVNNEPFPKHWPAGGPWRPGAYQRTGME